MSALHISWQHFFPWISLLAGLAGSLHCVGMCGGLVTATCHKGQDIIRYQLGRLLAYLVLGLFGGFVGSLFLLKNPGPIMSTVPGMLMGILFLYWGIQNYRGKNSELPMPKFMSKAYSFLYQKLVYKNIRLGKSFFTGLISIFLPCGLLYGIVIGTFALQNPLLAAVSMLFFWMGTVPAMVLAPHFLLKYLNPLKLKLPKTYALSLIMIGLITVSFRIFHYQDLQKKIGPNGPNSELQCH